MRTHRQLQASRRNGALSRGPVTAAGKARAALNSTKLGFLSQTVVLANESENRYQLLREQLAERHQPATEEELECIHEMANAQWRLLRMQSYEVAMLDYQREADAPAVANRHEQIDQTTINMLAFRAIHDADRALAYVHRYESSYRRTYRRALQELRSLQAGREKQKCENEPSTPQTQEHPATPESPAPIQPEQSCSGLATTGNHRSPQTGREMQKCENEPNTPQTQEAEINAGDRPPS